MGSFGAFSDYLGAIMGLSWAILVDLAASGAMACTFLGVVLGRLGAVFNMMYVLKVHVPPYRLSPRTLF